MKYFSARIILLPLALAAGLAARAGDAASFPAPVTPRDFYNAGTRLLAATNFSGAEQMLESALAAQDGRVQPMALYNLGHVRFAAGLDLLKQTPDAQKVSAQAGAALAAGADAIREGESALAENELDKIIFAYLEGHGARKNLRAAQKAVQAAMETYGGTLQKWRRAADDFHGAAELNPADTNAARNAEIVEAELAKLVDTLRKMQSLAGQMRGQQEQLGKILSRLKGQIPAPNAPPGGKGEDDDEDGNGSGSGDANVLPESLSGKEEGAGREGGQLQAPLSPEQAAQMLDGLLIDGSRRLPMGGEKEGSPPADRKGRNW